MFGVLSGVLFLLLAILIMRKVTKAKKTSVAVVMSKIDEERECETKRKSKSELEVKEEEEEDAGIAAADEAYIDNTVFLEYDETYDNHELYNK